MLEPRALGIPALRVLLIEAHEYRPYQTQNRVHRHDPL
jgi:hypothetical protein